MIKVYKGTELKLNVSISGANKPMSEYDFEIELYVGGGKPVKRTKEECIKGSNDNTYIVLLDTNELGKTGKLILKCTAYIPDNDFKDNLRTEVTCVDTDIMILNTL